MEVVGAWGSWTLLEASPEGKEEKSRYQHSKTLCVSWASPGSPCTLANADVLVDFIIGLAGCQHVPSKFKHWKREAMFSNGLQLSKH